LTIVLQEININSQLKKHFCFLEEVECVLPRIFFIMMIRYNFIEYYDSKKYIFSAEDR